MTKQKKKTIFCLIAKSGTGKDTILKKLKPLLENKIQFMVPVTTRKMRPGEKDGVDYWFVSHPTFFGMMHNGELLENRHYTVYVSNNEMIEDYYGHKFPQSPYNLLNGSYDIYQKIKANKEYKVVPIYIDTPDEIERLYRMMTREVKKDKPNFHEVARRYIMDNKLFPDSKIKRSCKNSTFINRDVEKCVTEIFNFIKERIE